LKIGLLTDAPKHNLALMKLSAYHKAQGDEIIFNLPLFKAEYSYASVLFKRNKKKFFADEFGGPAYNGAKLTTDVEKMQPDYSLFGRDYSLGYTFRPCFNSCGFCKVPLMDHPDIDHHSIWEFHDSRFNKICILNNNTFQDPRWKETFEEIWDADLTVIDENGYDIRLLDDEKAEALKKTKFRSGLYGFAWDRMQDESLVLHGFEIAKKYGIMGHNTHVYILAGYDTTEEEDIHRCQKVVDFNASPYIMPYKNTERLRQFKRMFNLFYYRKYKTVKEAWESYKK
jgi:hypothetical protein